jgi:hypothetical protein
VNTLLTDVSLRILLGRIRTIISLMTRLVAIPAWPVRWQNIRTLAQKYSSARKLCIPCEN